MDISERYAAELTLSPEVREWLEAHTDPNAWRRDLQPGQLVVAIDEIWFVDTCYDEDEEDNFDEYQLYASVKFEEFGTVVEDHPCWDNVWLIDFGRNREWWIEYQPCRKDYEPQSLIAPIEYEPLENDPRMYDGTLL